MFSEEGMFSVSLNLNENISKLSNINFKNIRFFSRIQESLPEGSRGGCECELIHRVLSHIGRIDRRMVKCSMS